MPVATKSKNPTEAEVDAMLDEEADAIIAGLDENNLAKLSRFTAQAVERTGIIGIRTGGPTWLKLRREVVSAIYGSDRTIAEIEEREE